MEELEDRLDRGLLEAARERARQEGRELPGLVEDALRAYLEATGGNNGERTFSEILDSVAEWQREHGIKPLSEEEATAIAVEEQHAWRRGE